MPKRELKRELDSAKAAVAAMPRWKKEALRQASLLEAILGYTRKPGPTKWHLSTISFRHGERTCAWEPGQFCPFFMTRMLGQLPHCGLFNVELDDGGGWVLRCDQCLAIDQAETARRTQAGTSKAPATGPGWV